jgi:8-oxo-dGTP pyrophosphatase MutT (NUDIX family)
MAADVQFHVIGDFAPGQVRTRWVESTRQKVPELEAQIEHNWEAAQRRPGVRLIDLPMCRLESFRAGSELDLDFSLTSYKTFVGTHYADPQVAQRFGRGTLAYAMGMSAVVTSADGFFLLGKRNASVAHYAGRVHTFAGTLEPEEAEDVFAAIARELDEELHVSRNELSDLKCMGLVEDISLHQPELVFDAVSILGREKIAERLDPSEHSQLLCVPVKENEVRQVVVDPSLTPVARSALLLCGKRRFGPAWFDEALTAVNLRQS